LGGLRGGVGHGTGLDSGKKGVQLCPMDTERAAPTRLTISEGPMTFQEFRTLAWEAANETARDLGWVRSCDELHEAVKTRRCAMNK
jgi:hypothetical protein